MADNLNHQPSIAQTVFFIGRTPNYKFKVMRRAGGFTEMEKTAIKVIKRNKAEAQNACEPQVAVSEEKIERRTRREMVETVANWISERREKNRLEEIAAIRKIFGNESLLSEA
jgi:hypothetical protein